ncbi:aminotransferase class IV family protein [Streptomyces fulvorobeus]|uniref:Branched-subunit amino acid aminotransferase/4-amino-4-deoxychorismate lyase n=1 Tax=Streptomyces fulvorobeus TaxID=284028 RepID=A0A7J0C4N2_9ACTN|nr:aminotransferase class IV family protein [Streptomyces fulvorobeus]NYE40754.1 branched-subunit amino acid aminotransferase/4-amino-4-deoxychorismate lyase [Streptomyces fulvorobeus]GFM97057.1 hypothetical protein Sfulv_18680 [Streptomyces fulvorobeus]
MTTAARSPYAEVDGHPATEDDLRVAAFFPYGHFTAMQIRGAGVRGLDLHLGRLDAGNRELFGLPLDGERVRGLIAHALEGAGVLDGSVRVHGLLPPGGTETTVLVTVREPVVTAAAPQSLMSVPYTRVVPHIKRPGEFGQTYFGRLARQSGFDDALLTAPGGVVAEGAVTNIGLWDGTSVIWPDAPALTGITMTLLEQGLGRAGSVRRPVTLEDLGGYRSAFVTNSQGIAAVHRIDDVSFEVDEELMGRLGKVYGDVTWDSVR